MLRLPKRAVEGQETLLNMPKFVMCETVDAFGRRRRTTHRTRRFRLILLAGPPTGPVSPTRDVHDEMFGSKVAETEPQ
jgi:hypothetical protein